MTSGPFPYLPARVEVGGLSLVENAVVDSGFNWDFAIPVSRSVGLQPVKLERIILANGIGVDAFVFEGRVQLGDLELVPAEIIAIGSNFVIGMGILRRYEVILDHGRRVIVNP